MNIICSADWHIQETCPENRTDSDYLQTCLDKISFIFEYVHEQTHITPTILIVAGDIFDTWRTSYYTMNKLIQVMKWIPVYVVAGQHDLPYHTSLSRSPLSLLQSAGFAKIITKLSSHGISIYGAGFGEEIPVVTTPNDFNILITHRMMIQQKLWVGQDSYDSAYQFLQKYNFDLVISGDNHQTFVEEYNGRFVINSGSLMRKRSNQMDHKPCIFKFDTETKQVEQILIPVKPVSEVFNIEKIEKEKRTNIELDAFVAGLGDTVQTTFDYVANVYATCAKINDSRISNIAKRVFDMVVR